MIHTRGTSRKIEVLRGAWGLVLLLDPRRVMHTLGVRIDTKSMVIGRILGARHLTQAVLSGVQPSPEVLAMGAWVDVVHALTAVGLSGADPARRRAGLLDATVAAAWSAAGYRDLNGAPPAPAGRQQLRDHLARSVLAVVPGGHALLQRANRVRHQQGRR
jgi:hypothetical protein